MSDPNQRLPTDGCTGCVFLVAGAVWLAVIMLSLEAVEGEMAAIKERLAVLEARD